MSPLSVALALLVGGALGAGTPPRPPERVTAPASLADVVLPSDYVLAADGTGRTIGWDPDTRVLAAWQADGALQSACRLDDARLPTRLSDHAAVRGGLALISSFDYAAGSEDARKAIVVDLGSCNLVRSWNLPGRVLSIEATRDGWLVVANADDALLGSFSFSILDDRGEVTGTFDLTPAFDAMLEELDWETEPPTARSGRMISAQGEVWLMPNADYELWRLPQHARSLRRVKPPPCLRVEGKFLDAEESAALRLRAAATFPEEVRRFVERRAADPTTPGVFRAATTTPVTYRSWIAVRVSDETIPGGARVDFWDAVTEQIVAVVALPGELRLVSFTQEGAWVAQEGKALRRVPLPDLLDPVEDPCKLKESLGDPQSERGTGAAGEDVVIELRR